MVSHNLIYPLRLSCHFPRSLWTVRRASSTIGSTITFMLVQLSSKVQALIQLFAFRQHSDCGPSAEQNLLDDQFFFFFFFFFLLLLLLLLLLLFTHQSFLHQHVSDSKSPQVSRTLLSILSVLNNVVVNYQVLSLVILYLLFKMHQLQLV